MKVFVTGASGYIGFAVATRFRRAGHKVFGLVRSEQKAQRLANAEIHPVIGDMQHPDSYRHIAEQCAVIIHTASDLQNDTLELDKKTVETILEIGSSGARPKTFIYTSGCWCIGDTGEEMADETTPLHPIDMVAWRVDMENLVLDSQSVNGIVIRPGCVYGKQGGLTGMWFNGAYNEKHLQVVGDGHNYWTMVHVDDLAEAYILAGEKGFKGELFNISDRSCSTVHKMANAVARVTGYAKDISYIPVDEAAKHMGGLAEAIALNQHVDSRKAVRLLGWQPKFGGFVDEIETYFEAWKAANE